MLLRGPPQALGIPVLLRGRNALLAAETGRSTLPGRDGDCRPFADTIRFQLGGCGPWTGSGKTLAYLLPLIQRLREEEAKGLVQRKIARPRAAVLAPSRELCAQVVVWAGARSDDWRCLAALAHRRRPAFGRSLNMRRA